MIFNSRSTRDLSARVDELAKQAASTETPQPVGFSRVVAGSTGFGAMFKNVAFGGNRDSTNQPANPRRPLMTLLVTPFFAVVALLASIVVDSISETQASLVLLVMISLAVVTLLAVLAAAITDGTSRRDRRRQAAAKQRERAERDSYAAAAWLPALAPKSPPEPDSDVVTLGDIEEDHGQW